MRAWAQIDAEGALRAAREADKLRQIRSSRLRPLHGIPIGVKDVIGTAELRTEYNSPIYRGHRTNADAAAVATLRAAGAIVIGKTETVEFAAWRGRISLARNPNDLSRTPGGSSSGSAAAVADCMVPLTLGTQTGGSIIRPASYCGVVGFKPTFNTVSTEGVKRYSGTLDTLGWYARSVEDVELIARIFEVSDESQRRPLQAEALRVGFCGTPYLEAAGPETRAALTETRKRLIRAGATVADIELDEKYANLNECRQIVMRAEGRVSFLDLERTQPEKISPGIRETMKRVENRALCSALDHAAVLRPAFDELARNFDAIVAPSAPGEAPSGLEIHWRLDFQRIVDSPARPMHQHTRTDEPPKPSRRNSARGRAICGHPSVGGRTNNLQFAAILDRDGCRIIVRRTRQNIGRQFSAVAGDFSGRRDP